MPVEIYDINEFIEIAKRASECRIKRREDCVKVKLRTKKYLYTIKIKPEQLDEVLSRIKSVKPDIQIVDLS